MPSVKKSHERTCNCVDTKNKSVRKNCAVLFACKADHNNLICTENATTLRPKLQNHTKHQDG